MPDELVGQMYKDEPGMTIIGERSVVAMIKRNVGDIQRSQAIDKRSEVTINQQINGHLTLSQDCPHPFARWRIL